METAKVEETPFEWEKIVILSRRYFRNDWKKVMDKLKEQLDTPFTCKPFHAKKGLMIFEDKNHAKLLCKNRGWTTVGRFYVKFEEWNQGKHAIPKLVSSYGGWVKFRGVPLHAWNMNMNHRFA
ncbi:hypothetical protein E5676_scaffold411G00200 [Cucumis melo var. makuwa]|uniref:DUF4283 domain-containing protein n=1 Tax=Cucumis melo var. makuwa TaxID=1194695 RepID=A0A5D3D384_CUCMM|nr:hypothetical protein E6C27_scaffold138G002250 [Cucumis melo var. makuwa]TYK18098.1 hypothetical protein E5676_scaffold411G00200 [Cucumis melo var. makuwa]